MKTITLRMCALLPVAVLAFAGCSDDSGDSNDAATGDKVTIVASTNVYGDIAAAVAGDRATVTSLITSATQDPHEYEASTQDRLAIDEATLVVKNGGGFDPFIDTLLETAKGDAVVLDAVEISGKPTPEGFNEHVWYDFPSVEKVAERIGTELAKVDPDGASTYTANAQAFVKEVQGLEAAAEAVKAEANGKGAAITEPVPLYLLTEVGLVNKTPAEFSEAVEEGTDVPPRVLQETLDLFKGGNIAVLAYNAQAADDTTEQVKQAAEDANVAVIDFTETLPDGKSYLQWQQDNIDHLATAVK